MYNRGVKPNRTIRNTPQGELARSGLGLTPTWGGPFCCADERADDAKHAC